MRRGGMQQDVHKVRPLFQPSSFSPTVFLLLKMQSSKCIIHAVNNLTLVRSSVTSNFAPKIFVDILPIKQEVCFNFNIVERYKFLKQLKVNFDPGKLNFGLLVRRTS